MNPIAISVTGRLGDDPRKFATRGSSYIRRPCP